VLYRLDKLLIIGGSSYVGRNLSSRLCAKYDVISSFFSNKGNISYGEAIHLDIRDTTSVARVIKSVQPKVIYLLSYSLKDLEGTIIRGASNVMQAVKASASRVIFLSTDAVFGGLNKVYYENDMPDYINEYGRSKYEAEKIVLSKGGFVVRTSLVYGFDPLDIRTLELLKDLQGGATRIGYFSDEFRCPIFIDDLCNMLAYLAVIDSPELLHITGPECISRLTFARKIASAFGFNVKHIRAALFRESGLKRPQHLCLDSSLAQQVLDYRISSVEEVLNTYNSKSEALRKKSE